MFVMLMCVLVWCSFGYKMLCVTAALCWGQSWDVMGQDFLRICTPSGLSSNQCQLSQWCKIWRPWSHLIFIFQHSRRPAVLDAEEHRKLWSHSVFTLLTWINNLSIPCSSVLFEQCIVRCLFDQCSPPKEHKDSERTLCEGKAEEPKQNYSEIFFDLHWMNNKVVQPQTATWHQRWKVVNWWGFFECVFSAAAWTSRPEEVAEHLSIIRPVGFEHKAAFNLNVS